MTTIGIITIILDGIEATLHVVIDTLNIPYDGILGSDFLNNAGAYIDYKNKSIAFAKNKITAKMFVCKYADARSVNLQRTVTFKDRPETISDLEETQYSDNENCSEEETLNEQNDDRKVIYDKNPEFTEKLKTIMDEDINDMSHYYNVMDGLKNYYSDESDEDSPELETQFDSNKELS